MRGHAFSDLLPLPPERMPRSLQGAISQHGLRDSVTSRACWLQVNLSSHSGRLAGRCFGLQALLHSPGAHPCVKPLFGEKVFSKCSVRTSQMVGKRLGNSALHYLTLGYRRNRQAGLGSLQEPQQLLKTKCCGFRGLNPAFHCKPEARTAGWLHVVQITLWVVVQLFRWKWLIVLKGSPTNPCKRRHPTLGLIIAVCMAEGSSLRVLGQKKTPVCSQQWKCWKVLQVHHLIDFGVTAAAPLNSPSRPLIASRGSGSGRFWLDGSNHKVYGHEIYISLGGQK